MVLIKFCGKISSKTKHCSEKILGSTVNARFCKGMLGNKPSAMSMEHAKNLF